jgi:hypothetical protein
MATVLLDELTKRGFGGASQRPNEKDESRFDITIALDGDDDASSISTWLTAQNVPHVIGQVQA